MSRHKQSSSIPGRVTVCLLAFVTLAAAGCGGSSKHGSTSSHTHAATTLASTRASAGSPPAALAGVRGRVLTAGEMKGFSPQGRRLLGINPQSWVVENQVPAAQRAAEVAILKREGFVAAVRENLIAAGPSGLSLVEQFRSPGGARAELFENLKHAKVSTGGHLEPFPVPGIPAASGFGTTPAANVAFTKGNYYYLVGASGPPSGGSGSARALVIAAAQHLYRRVAQ